MKNRFDLEQDILDVTGMTKDLDTLLWRIMDSPDGPLTEDDLANIIIGLRYTLQLRGDKLWDTFCQTYELDQYRIHSTSNAGHFDNIDSTDERSANNDL